MWNPFAKLKPSHAISAVVDAGLNRIIARDVKFRFTGKIKLAIGGQTVELEYDGVIDPQMNSKFIDIDGNGIADKI